MLWLLLTSMGYLAALGAAVGGVAWVAQSRYSLLQRLLARAADRVLARVVDPECEASVTHTDTGEGGRRRRCRRHCACR